MTSLPVALSGSEDVFPLSADTHLQNTSTLVEEFLPINFMFVRGGRVLLWKRDQTNAAETENLHPAFAGSQDNKSSTQAMIGCSFMGWGAGCLIHAVYESDD